MANNKSSKKLFALILFSSLLLITGCDLLQGSRSGISLTKSSSEDRDSVTETTTSHLSEVSITSDEINDTSEEPLPSDVSSDVSEEPLPSDVSSDVNEETSPSDTSSSASEFDDGRYILAINGTNYTGISTYADGNYGVKAIGGVTYEHYRLYRNNQREIEFNPYIKGPEDKTISAALLNMTAISGIRKIELTYRTSSVTSNNARLYYGESNIMENYVDVADSTFSVATTMRFHEPTNYFRLESGAAKLYLQELKVFYAGEGEVPPVNFLDAGADKYRLNPTINNFNPEEGDTVTVPVAINHDGTSYTVSQTKTYTYYSFDYVSNYQSSLGDINRFAYTDPLDLAAFYTAFGTYPANYVVLANNNRQPFYAAQDVFGDQARMVQEFSLIGGYVRSVPWRPEPGTNAPLYYELDIDLDGRYYTGARGVGRLVCYRYGFDDGEGHYDYAPTCVYTDDHYATFQEYLNTGEFGTRFNGYYGITNATQSMRTSHVWGAPTTLSPAS